jgi:hypothetical protein
VDGYELLPDDFDKITDKSLLINVFLFWNVGVKSGAWPVHLGIRWQPAGWSYPGLCGYWSACGHGWLHKAAALA